MVVWFLSRVSELPTYASPPKEWKTKMFTFNSSPTAFIVISSRRQNAFCLLQKRFEKIKGAFKDLATHHGDIIRCRRNNNFECLERKKRAEKSDKKQIWSWYEKQIFPLEDECGGWMMKSSKHPTPIRLVRWKEILTQTFRRIFLLFFFCLFFFCFSGSGFSIDILFCQSSSGVVSVGRFFPAAEDVCFRFDSMGGHLRGSFCHSLFVLAPARCRYGMRTGKWNFSICLTLFYLLHRHRLDGCIVLAIKLPMHGQDKGEKKKCFYFYCRSSMTISRWDLTNRCGDGFSSSQHFSLFFFSDGKEKRVLWNFFLAKIFGNKLFVGRPLRCPLASHSNFMTLSN